MRVFGLLTLVIVLAIMAVLVKRQLTSFSPVSSHPVAGSASDADNSVPDVRSPAQAHQLEQQVQGDLDRASQEHAQQIERALDEGASKP
jgi:hypothetical protein